MPSASIESRLTKAACLALVLGGISDAGVVAAQTEDQSLQRARSLVASMTTDEKLQMVHGTGRPPRAKPPGYAGKVAGVSRLGIPELYLADGPNGVGNGSTGVTAFPAPISSAASFDEGLVYDVSAALGNEDHAKGNGAALSPTVNILRIPQWGRAFESFSEDPFLAARMARSVVTGIQSQGVIATVKHFAANNQEYGRTFVSAEVPERALREIYLPAFREAVSAGVLSVMCAYGRVDGIYACQNGPLLDDILKRQWGFKGFVVSDWAATHDTVETANAGLDLEMPSGPEPEYPAWFGPKLAAAVQSGAVPIARLDDMATRVVYAMDRIGLIGTSGLPQNRDQRAATPAHAELARRLAEEGTVLLKNEGSILPLVPAQTRRIAVIGPGGADNPIGTGTGNGSASVQGEPTASPIAAMRARAGSDVAISYAAGTAGTAALPTWKIAGGWRAEYFDRSDFSGSKVLARDETGVEFRNTPAAALQGKWSARWTGRFTPTASGTYRFSLDSAGISKLFIDGREVLSNFGQDRSAVAHSLVELKAGVPVEVRLDYVADLLLKREIKVQLGMLEPDPQLLQQAVEAARHADVAIVFVSDLRIEGGDTPDLSLPGDQDRLIEAVAEANPHTVVVLNTGGPAFMPWLSKVSAVVEAWYPGQENGRAISRILFGDANPAGRLPITFPQTLQQTPAADPTRYPGVNDTARYEEGLLVGYRWFDAKGEQPLFPFGYGLSYTKFGYGEVSATPAGASAKIKVHVSNLGGRDGDEVVQLYLQAPQSAGEPPRVLKAFQRIALTAGTGRDVELDLPDDAFMVWDVASHDWRRITGLWKILVGSSSRDIRSEASFTVE